MGFWLSRKQFWNGWNVLFVFIKHSPKVISVQNFAAVISQDLILLRSIKRQPILILLSCCKFLEFFYTWTQPWYTWGVTCSFIKYWAEMGLLNDRQERGCNQSGSKSLLGSMKSQPRLYFTVAANFLSFWVSRKQFWNSWIVLFVFIKHSPNVVSVQFFCGCNQSGSNSA